MACCAQDERARVRGSDGGAGGLTGGDGESGCQQDQGRGWRGRGSASWRLRMGSGAIDGGMGAADVDPSYEEDQLGKQEGRGGSGGSGGATVGAIASICLATGWLANPLRSHHVLQLWPSPVSPHGDGCLRYLTMTA